VVTSSTGNIEAVQNSDYDPFAKLGATPGLSGQTPQSKLSLWDERQPRRSRAGPRRAAATDSARIV